MRSWAGASGIAAELPVGRKLAFLSQPDAYPEPTTRVERVETHFSWVFLTDDRAYKLKKPLHLRRDGLDLRTLARRARNCVDEVRLNRRLAPEVYLGAAALTLEPTGRLAFEGEGEVVDWLVVMRRLPAEQMLDQVIARGEARRADVERVVAALARLYRGQAPAPLSAAGYRARLLRTTDDDVAALCDLGYGLDRARLAGLGVVQRELLRRHPELFDPRIAAGRVLEGHGDLRPEHVCLEPLAVIDCLEFDQDLRILDTLDELAFLALECERLGAPEVGAWALEAYAQELRDDYPPELLAFYRRLRALRRAKVSMWHLDDPGVREPERWVEQARRYLELAESPARV
ncbi:MAG: hypothetical protein AB7N76_10770 [Planctomycetota bacterium]